MKRNNKTGTATPVFARRTEPALKTVQSHGPSTASVAR